MRKWGRLGALAFTLLGGAAMAGSGTSAGVGGPPYEVEEIEEEEVLPMEEQDTAPVESEAMQGDLEEIESQDVYQTEQDVSDLEDDGSLISDDSRYTPEEKFGEDLQVGDVEEIEVDDGRHVKGESEALETRTGELEEIETEEVTIVERDRGGLQSGPYVMLGGGVDSYTGGLSDDMSAGLAWGATAGVDAGRLGFELGYSGGANEIDAPGNIGSGADIVRNSGQAAVKLNLTRTALHPYVLGGIGIERHTVRNGQNLGFENDTSGYVPAAAGLRWNIGKVITADARFSYNFMFDDEFAPGDPGGNRMQGMLTLGGTY